MTGPEALEARIVDALAGLDDVVPRAIEHAGSRAGANPDTLQTIKHRLYAPVLEALNAPAPA